MAEELLARYKGQIGVLELVPSSGGVFEVTVDGQVVFSKKQLDRFPEEGEVEELMAGFLRA